MSQAFEQARQLLQQDPLPSDAFAQLEALEASIDADEADRFDDLWEALYAAGVVLPDD